jgi:cytoskeletal protein CcmA (bactofilin family)
MTMATAPSLQAAANTGVDHAGSESRVDRDSHFNGLFETKQNLRIEGIAEGEIQCEGMVTVAEGARVKAKVTAKAVTIAGVLEGDVICRDVFQIMPTGQVDATVSARRLIVQEGGFYNGEFHMITGNSTGSVAGSSSLDALAATRQAAGKPAAGSKPAAGGDLISNDEWWAKLSGTPDVTEEPEAKPDKKASK